MLYSFFNIKNFSKNYLTHLFLKFTMYLITMKVVVISSFFLNLVISIACVYLFSKLVLVYANKSDNSPDYTNDSINTSLYLNSLYLFHYNFSVNYIINLATYFAIKCNIFLKNNKFIVNFIYKKKNLWRPLFKKYSYLGYSRFTNKISNKYLY